MSSQAGLWTGFALKRLAVTHLHTGASSFPTFKTRQHDKGTLCGPNTLMSYCFAHSKFKPEVLCYRCTVVKNHDIALLLSAQDSTAGLCIILCSCSQCTSVPQRHKLGTVLHFYDPNKHGLHSEGSPLSYIIRRRPELVSCSTYCWHFNQLILIKRRIEHRNRFHTNAAIFTRWMNNSENLHRKIIQRWDKETWEPFMFNVKYELPLWEETEKEDFTACLTSVTGDANSGC